MRSQIDSELMMRELPKLPMLIVAAVQGLLLYGLYHAFDTHSWPSKSPLWSYPMWTIAVAVPLLLLLSIDRSNFKRAARQVVIFGVLLASLATYTGYQALPFDEFPLSTLSFAFIWSITLACFKALMYLQQRADQVPLTYQVLFTNSWRNFLVAALSAIFVLVFWLILLLWGQLFEVIEIDFFWDLFKEDWFIIPTLTVAFCIGVIIFRDLTLVIDSITRLLHWLFKLLLPLVVVVAAIFVAALPFVGLEVLWSTGSGTALLLWLLAAMLFFANAVYQDGREPSPYPPIIHRMIFAGLCFMPIISALSLYGLVLRLGQYGWSVERCWAFVVWLILSLFAVGYVVGIVRRRDAWTNDLARVNTIMGIVVLAVMLLVNSPILDFRKISLASQLHRIDSGEIELRELDFWYIRRHLARPGFLAMEQMKNDSRDTDPELFDLINSPVNHRYANTRQSTNRLWANMNYRPGSFELPARLKSKIESERAHATDGEMTLVRIDLDEDGQDEYLLLVAAGSYLGSSQFYYLSDDGWESAYVQYSVTDRDADLRERIANAEIKLVEPRFKIVDIGGVILRPATH